MIEKKIMVLAVSVKSHIISLKLNISNQFVMLWHRAVSCQWYGWDEGKAELEENCYFKEQESRGNSSIEDYLSM